MKRVCLFAGFDRQGIIDDYVVYYVKELSKLADVYYWADCVMNNGELEKLTQYVKGAYAERHEKYDFGSWQELINKIGWEKLAEYDELILVNDSCYGPMYSLDPIFKRMEEERFDFWGMTANDEIAPHVQSYFMVFNNNVIKSVAFQTFFNDIKKEKGKEDVIINYEVGNTVNLKRNGFKYGVILTSPINPTVYWKKCLDEGVPCLKVAIFTNLGFAAENIYNIKEYVFYNTQYDFNLIKNHIKRLRINFTLLMVITAFWLIKRRCIYKLKKIEKIRKLLRSIKDACIFAKK